MCSIGLGSLDHHYKYFLIKTCLHFLSILSKTAKVLVLFYGREMDKAEEGWLTDLPSASQNVKGRIMVSKQIAADFEYCSSSLE